MKRLGLIKAEFKDRVRINATTATSLSISWSYVGNGVVQYDVANPNREPVKFVIYRGVKGIVPKYPFGNAFYPDYIGMGISTPITGDRITSQYEVGMVVDKTGKKMPAFVFIVPGMSEVSILEGGFEPGWELEVDVYPVTYERDYNYVIFWNPAQYIDYVLEVGEPVTPVTDPYITTMSTYKCDQKMDPIFNDLVLTL